MEWSSPSCISSAKDPGPRGLFPAAPLVECKVIHPLAPLHLRRQVCLLEQKVGGFFIDMVERKWIKSTNEIKAVFFFCKNTNHVTGVHKAHQRDEDLEGAVHDLDVAVLQGTADDRDVGMVIQPLDARH